MIQEVTFEEVKHLRSLAARDGVHLAQLRGAKWWAWSELRGEDEPLLAGVACLAPITGGRVRVRSVYVLPAWRGRGIGTALAEAAIAAAPRGRPIEVLAYNPRWYAARGFRAVSTRHAGTRRVARMIREASIE